jgi:L-fucose isomerase-like protein
VREPAREVNMTAGDNDTFLIFGGLPTAYLARSRITDDLEVIRRTLGLAGVELPVEAIAQRQREVEEDAAQAIARRLISGALFRRSDQPADERVLDAARMYLAMRSLVEEHAASAVTMVCAEWKSPRERPVPCVPLMLLAEGGVPAGCQGDLDALLTMVLFRRAAGRCSFMGGLHERDGKAVVSHDVLPRSFADPNRFSDYTIGDYHGQKPSPTVHVRVPGGGPVTLARLTRNLETLLLARGTLLGCADAPIRCRNALVIETSALEVLMSLRVDNQYHFAVCAGDCVEPMADAARAAGIDPNVV